MKICGANPARANGLYPKKGCIRPGSDADILFLDEEFLVDTVFARGRKMVEHGKALVKGTFETYKEPGDDTLYCHLVNSEMQVK